MAKRPRLSLTIDPIVARSKINTAAWVKETVQMIVDDAQLAGLSQASRRRAEEMQAEGKTVKNYGSGKGGRMPIDTGFLRASGQMRLGGMPSGPTRPNSKAIGPINPGPASYQGSPTVVQSLGNFTIGTSIFFGWTAAYANKINLRYGFLDNAMGQARKFSDIVALRIRMRSE